MEERELKYLLDGKARQRVAGRIRSLPGLVAPPHSLRLVSVYWDTAEGALEQAGVSLRLRQGDGMCMQTLKVGRSHAGGMSSVQEHEAAAPEARVNLLAIADVAVRREVVDLIGGAPLEPVCEIHCNRLVARVAAAPDAQAEIALDQVQAQAGGRHASFCELEIEHLTGPLALLFDLARTLLDGEDVRPSLLSKAARGARLRMAGRIHPGPAARPQRRVVLNADMPAVSAAQRVLRECLEQVLENADAARRSDDAEVVHQLRIGLRRLRSAFSLFKPILPDPARTALAAEARWLGRSVGTVRDLDVVTVDLLAAEMAAHPQEAGFPALADLLTARMCSAHDALRRTLASPHCGRFLIDLTQFIEAGDWLVTADVAPDLRAIAAQGLDARWRSVRRKARRFRHMTIEQRHALRKALKALRYAAEFVAPLYPERAVARFIRRLKELQDLFGHLNDAAVLESLLCAPDMLADQPAQVHRAAGWLIGANQARAQADWPAARTAWKVLKRHPRFW